MWVMSRVTVDAASDRFPLWSRDGTKIVFGSTETAEEAAARIRHVHGRVRGTTTEDGGRFPEGTRYDAGTTMGWLKASVELALQRPELGPELRTYLAGLQN